jgi:23S rRNA (adenine2503-C2)-methyltransferase
MSTSAPKVDLLGLLRDELVAFLRELGQPSYRATQILSWLHRGASFGEMTNLPRELRARLAEAATPGSLMLCSHQEAPDGAVKFGYQTSDGHSVESVLIPHHNRTTVCVSSQVGCAFGCAFCATSQDGLTRDLAAGEIVEQVVRVQQAAATRRVRNVVFMGMGEPLANYESVIKAVRLLNSREGLGIGARHIAISTCGLPDAVRRLAGEGLQVGLAISLHAATDEVRDRIVPLNRQHPLAELMAAARFFFEKTGRKVALQYVVIPGLNDTQRQAEKLAGLTRALPSMVNVIPRNPMEKIGAADAAPARRFAGLLRRRGMEAVVRRSRGSEVLGACGQLRPRPGQPKPAETARARPADS